MSLFNLIESKEGLSSANMGASNATYLRIPTTQASVGAQFGGNRIEFRWSTSGQRWWVPNRSYMRIRASLRIGANAAPPTLADGIAPAMGFAGNLFQQVEYQAGNQRVSFVPDFVAQVDAVKHRSGKSQAWLESIGAGTNFWQASFDERLNAVAKDGHGPLAVAGYGSPVGRLGLGFDATTTFAYVAATGLVTIVAGDGEDLQTIFKAGDTFTFTANGTNDGLPRTVLIVDSDTEMHVSIIPGDDDVAAEANVEITRSRPSEGGVAQAGDFEVVWVPPLSIFDVNHALPAGEHQLILTSQSSTAYQLRGIEIGPTWDNKPIPVPGTDFTLTITDLQYFPYVIDGPRVDDAVYLLDLNNVQCFSQQLVGNNYSALDFQVPASTRGLTVAYQANSAGTGTPRVPATKFTMVSSAGAQGLEQSLVRFSVMYAGVNKPSPDADPVDLEQADPANNVQQLTSLWSDSLIYSGGFADTGGGERLQDWLTRGLYMYAAWPKDGSDASTRASVYSQFSAAFGSETNRVLLFPHSAGSARITVQNGAIVRVEPGE